MTGRPGQGIHIKKRGRHSKRCRPRYSAVARRANRISSFPDELLPAFGAGDGDLALPPGNPDALMAPGAVIIPVLPVLHFIKKQQKPPVLPVALIGIPGHGAKQCPKQKGIGKQGQNQIDPGHPEKQGYHAKHDARPQDGHIQLVRSVPPCHETAQSLPQPGGKLPPPISQSVHHPSP